MDTRKFFELLYPDASPTLWQPFWRLKDKVTAWKTMSEVSDGITFKDTVDIYFSVNLMATRGGTFDRGKTSDAVYSPGVWLDVDTMDGTEAGGHEPGCYPTKEEAIAELEKLLVPSILIDSGGGLHGYYLTNEHNPLIVGQLCEKWQTKLSKIWFEKGWRKTDKKGLVVSAWDSTFDLARVLRIPGSINGKYDPSRAVKIIKMEDLRYDTAAFNVDLPQNVKESPKEEPPLLKKEVKTPRKAESEWTGKHVAQDYCERAELKDCLLEGWSFDHVGKDGQDHYTRPGKDGGTSATWNEEVFYVFSSSAPPLKALTGYNKFQLYCVKHNLTASEAAIHLYSQGYGDRQPKRKQEDKAEGLSAAQSAAERSVSVGEDEDVKASKKPPCPSNVELSYLVQGTPLGVVLGTVREVIPDVEPLMPIAAGIALEGALLSSRVRIGNSDNDSYMPSVYVMLAAPTTRGKGTSSRAIMKAAKLLKVQRLKEGSEKSFLKQLGVMPWGILNIPELSSYLPKNSWKRPLLDGLTTLFDGEFMASCSEKTGTASVENAGPTACVEIQPDLFRETPCPDLIVSGCFVRFLVAHDPYQVAEESTIANLMSRREANFVAIADAYANHNAGLPLAMPHAKEEVVTDGDGKVVQRLGRWEHPRASVIIRVPPFLSVLQTFPIPKKLKAYAIRSVTHYLPIIAICLESPENLAAGQITYAAMEKADRILLAFYYSASRLYLDMADSITELNARKLADAVNRLCGFDPRKKISLGKLKPFARIGRNDREFGDCVKQAVDWGMVRQEKVMRGETEVTYLMPKMADTADTWQTTNLPIPNAASSLVVSNKNNINNNSRQADIPPPCSSGTTNSPPTLEGTVCPSANFGNSPVTTNETMGLDEPKMADKVSAIPSARQPSDYDDPDDDYLSIGPDDDDDLTFCPSHLLDEMKRLKAELRAAGKRPFLTPEQEDYFFGGKAS